MRIQQIIEFELRESESVDSTCTSTTGYFHYKTKISKAVGKSLIGLLFATKILPEAMYLTSPI